MHDDNIYNFVTVSEFYENAPDDIYIPSQDKQLIKKNLLEYAEEIFMPKPEEVLEAQETQEKLVNNLALYTGTVEDAIKELDFVRTQVDHLAMEYGQIANEYVDLYKKAQETNFSVEELHNLFISTMNAAFRENLSEEDIAEILEQMGNMLLNKYVTLDEFNKAIGYKFKAADSWLQEFTKIYNIKNIDNISIFDSREFLSKFSDYMHKNTPEVTRKDFNPDYVKANYAENRMYDRDSLGEKAEEYLKITSGILAAIYERMNKGNITPEIYMKDIISLKSFPKAVSASALGAAIGLYVTAALGNWLETNEKINKRYQNGVDYQYIPNLHNYFDDENVKKFYLHAEENRNLKELTPKYEENRNTPIDNYTQNTNFSTTLSPELSENLPEISQNVYQYFQTDISEQVKQTLVNLFDDFAQLKGFNSYNA